MKEKLLNDKIVIENNARELWQGKGADIGELNRALYEASHIILDMAEALNDEDKLTTINYVKNAFSDFEKACKKRDDYMLADCLYYEWRELLSIYIDVMGE